MNLKIKFLLLTSKSIPKNQRNEIRRRLRSDFSLKGFDEIKDLFYQSMEQRIYELFISSITSLLFKNKSSFECLYRAQLENLYLLIYLRDNPHEIESVFISGKFDKAKNDVKKKRKNIYKAYTFFSQRAHPDIEGLKAPYRAISLVVPPKEDMSKEEIDKYMRSNLKNIKLEPWIMFNNKAYNLILDEDVVIGTKNSIGIYDELMKVLEELYNVADNRKIGNYKDLWTKEDSKHYNRMRN